MLFLFVLLNAYFVSFIDKPQAVEPALSERALTQRAQWSIPTDELDIPVSAAYLDSLRAHGATVYHTSRWFNGATVEMDKDLAAKVKTWSFVTDVECTRDDSPQRPYFAPWRVQQASQTIDDPLQTDNQLNLYNLLPLHQAGFEGQGIVMALSDGGFYKANTLSCFRQKELELGHFDFTDDKDDFYGSTGAHGTECLSTISAIQDNYYGAATKAQYYLMRSEEDPHESKKEMDNLVAALEKADSLGVNVFSVSVGYFFFDNNDWDITYKQLDGKTFRVSRAATIAARKGMLVCIAAGNEGDDEWEKIDLPADADSILTVGAVDEDGNIGYFSSHGPTADGRIKPDVCAVGVRATIVTPSGSITRQNGTSFATPLLAGLAACLWSALPDESAMQIRERIIRSANRYDDPDPVRYGYGIPDAWKAYTMELPSGVEEVPSTDNATTQKFIRGDQILILRHGHIYNLAGQRLD